MCLWTSKNEFYAVNKFNKPIVLKIPKAITEFNTLGISVSFDAGLYSVFFVGIIMSDGDAE
jgi:hypothetical protein